MQREILAGSTEEDQQEENTRALAAGDKAAAKVMRKEDACDASQ